MDLKLTVKKIKNNYLILIVKGLVVFLFILALIRGVFKITDHYNVAFGYSENKIADYFYIIKTFSYLRPVVILLIPLIGIFIKRKIGWILIQSYFYFLFSNLVLMITKEDFIDYELIVLYLIAFLFIFLIITLMNKNKISRVNYGIDKKELISKNTIAFIIGISITTILTLIKAY